MKFVDRVKIFVKAGDGGKGCMSFLRLKYVPRGGPAGGDGGKGGDIIIGTRKSVHTLLDLTFHHYYFAKSGKHGQGANKHGANAPDLYITVPQGTLIKDAQDDRILADLVEDGATFLAARGGRGGRGNARFKSSVNQAPRYAEKGEAGEERWLSLELKILADVGLIGYPNTGKSTLLSRLSSATPKVADYEFTTLTPNLGVVYAEEEKSFTVADVPGLIEGAHAGKGLGLQFLRHIERTRLLVHVLDVSGTSGRDPIEDYRAIINELTAFNSEVALKTQVIALNKIDLLPGSTSIDKVKKYFSEKGIPCYPISALNGSGLQALTSGVWEQLAEIAQVNSSCPSQGTT